MKRGRKYRPHAVEFTDLELKALHAAAHEHRAGEAFAALELDPIQWDKLKAALDTALARLEREMDWREQAPEGSHEP
jgi:hypothetical protein